MWLVLCTQHDHAAHWAYAGLRARGLAPLELVVDQALAYAVRWRHRVGADGAGVEIALADGRTLHSGAIRGVLNRLVTAPAEYLLPMVVPADRLYASQELTAFYLSWLYGIPGPVLNRPTAQGLGGPWRHVSEWVCLASQAGLPTATYRQTSHSPPFAPAAAGRLFPPAQAAATVIAVGDRTAGAPAPPDVLDGCVRLRKLANVGLLGVEFAPGEAGPWTFAGATPLPDLTLGGPPLLDALAAELVAAPATHGAGA